MGKSPTNREDVSTIETEPDVKLPGPIDPVAEGARVARLLNASPENIIRACASICVVCTTLGQDRQAWDYFLAELAKGNIISAAEVRLGTRSPKLSKLKTIGEHADLLLGPHVLPLLRGWWTFIYAAVQNYKASQGEETSRVDHLIRTLKECPETSAVEHLEKSAKASSRAAKIAAADTAVVEAVANDTVGRPDHPDAIDVGAFVDAAPSQLILAEPKSRDWKLISEPRVEGDAPLCLSLHERVAESAVAVVFGRIVDLAAIERDFLPSCGFGKISHVFAVGAVEGSDLLLCDVIVVAERGMDTLLDADGIAQDAFRGNAREIAERLVPTATQKTHVFATEPSTGWHCIVAELNWSHAHV